MFEVRLEPDALADLERWIKVDGRIAIKIEALIENMRTTPFSGLGKPEKLKHQLTDLWSRRITQEHRLVYEVRDDLVIIHSCHGHYLK